MLCQAENFNVSIPYMQMKVVRVRDSKFGPALVVETAQRCGAPSDGPTRARARPGPRAARAAAHLIGTRGVVAHVA
jgi:hypothetical protein